MSKRILSLDGGGIRGAATTQFLARVEKELQDKASKSIRDCVDFYAGTSTGSIIALALATTDMSMDQINSLYDYDTAQKIFTENKGWFEIDGVNAPKFEAKDKTEVLKSKFGISKIGHVPPGKHVLAVTYAIEKRKPMVIKSTKNRYLDLYSVQAADAPVQPPPIFPPGNWQSPRTLMKISGWLTEVSLPTIPPCAPSAKPSGFGQAKI